MPTYAPLKYKDELADFKGKQNTACEHRRARSLLHFTPCPRSDEGWVRGWKWRGISLGFLLFFCNIYLLATRP